MAIPTAAAVYAIADREVGVHEGRDPNGNWNNQNKYADAIGVPNRAAWCQTFCTWLLLVSGGATLGPQHCDYTLTALEWFKSRNRLSFFPTLGAQAYMGPGGGEHVEWVIGYDDDYVYTIGGNTNQNGSAQGDGVYRQRRPRHDGHIYAYGVPKFAGTVYTADPDAAVAGTTYRRAAALVLPKPVPRPAPAYEPFPGDAWFKTKPKHAIITRMGQRLVAVGCGVYTSGPGPQWSDADRASYAKFQRSLGMTGAAADGWPGEASWKALKVPKA